MNIFKRLFRVQQSSPKPSEALVPPEIIGDHKIGPKGSCIVCGCTASAIRNFGWGCKNSESSAPRSPSARPPAPMLNSILQPKAPSFSPFDDPSQILAKLSHEITSMNLETERHIAEYEKKVLGDTAGTPVNHRGFTFRTDAEYSILCDDQKIVRGVWYRERESISNPTRNRGVVALAAAKGYTILNSDYETTIVAGIGGVEELKSGGGFILWFASARNLLEGA